MTIPIIELAVVTPEVATPRLSKGLSTWAIYYVDKNGEDGLHSTWMARISAVDQAIKAAKDHDGVRIVHITLPPIAY